MTKKTRMIPVVLAVVALLALSGAQANQQTDSANQSVTIPNCTVSLIKDVDVPAEVAGVLIDIPVKAGMQVVHDTLLAKIDDSEPQIQKKVADLEYKVANKQAEDTINVEFSKASHKVAEAEVLTALEANKRRKDTFTQAQMRRLYLTREQARLRIDKANFDLDVAKLTAEAKTEQVLAAQMGIDKRKIHASFDSEDPNIKGIVMEVYKRANEWVQPGEPVMRIVRMDRLKVDGLLNSADYNPDEIDGRPVVIEFQRARKEVARLTGRIVFASPEFRVGGKFIVRAEVDNQKLANGHWLLNPGKTTDMTIELAPLPALSRARQSAVK